MAKITSDRELITGIVGFLNLDIGGMRLDSRKAVYFSFADLYKIMQRDDMCKDTRTVKSRWMMLVHKGIIIPKGKEFTEGYLRVDALDYEYPGFHIRCLERMLAHTQDPASTCINLQGVTTTTKEE